MRAAGGHEDRSPLVDQRQAENVADGPAGDVEGQAVERATIRGDLELAEPAPGHPSAPNVTRGGKPAAVVSEGEIECAAVGCERQLTDVEPLEGMARADKLARGIDQHELGAGGAGDGHGRAVGREGDETGQGGRRDRRRHGARFEVDCDDRGTRRERHPRRAAVSGENHIMRLKADMDPAGLHQPPLPHIESDNIPRFLGDRDEAIGPTGGDGGRPTADRELGGDRSGGVEKRDRPGRPIRRRQTAAVGRDRHGHRRPPGGRHRRRSGHGGQGNEGDEQEQLRAGKAAETERSDWGFLAHVDISGQGSAVLARQPTNPSDPGPIPRLCLPTAGRFRVRPRKP